MNAKEAIEALKLEGGIEITGNPVRIGAFFEALVEAEKALEEVQQYRLIENATIGEIAEVLREFSKIGTVEECREAREKQIQKKPEYINGGISVCRECGKELKRCYDYCPDCGQAIQWNTENLEAAE